MAVPRAAISRPHPHSLKNQAEATELKLYLYKKRLHNDWKEREKKKGKVTREARSQEGLPYWPAARPKMFACRREGESVRAGQGTGLGERGAKP